MHRWVAQSGCDSTRKLQGKQVFPADGEKQIKADQSQTRASKCLRKG